MYCRPNFKTKKALKDAISRSEPIEVFSPGPFPAPENGITTLEGPHYPEAHKWYARVTVVNGYVGKVLS